ncbi:hypothetical protein MFFC18_33860 [Mariniblastus fucicola]|uniref:Uncharacterized protein n=1 Tax=Mariniblastus fucicola TaxID=980251 RepID=A0A5B9P9Q4_9BACT|nr:hypothetical protein MFFC18_33860 [Mariniblastus fucicola]
MSALQTVYRKLETVDESACFSDDNTFARQLATRHNASDTMMAVKDHEETHALCVMFSQFDLEMTKDSHAGNRSPDKLSLDMKRKRDG